MRLALSDVADHFPVCVHELHGVVTPVSHPLLYPPFTCCMLEDLMEKALGHLEKICMARVCSNLAVCLQHLPAQAQTDMGGKSIRSLRAGTGSRGDHPYPPTPAWSWLWQAASGLPCATSDMQPCATGKERGVSPKVER